MHQKRPVIPMRSVVFVMSNFSKIVFKVPYCLVSVLNTPVHPLLSKYTVSEGVPKVPGGHSGIFLPIKKSLPETVIVPVFMCAAIN